MKFGVLGGIFLLAGGFLEFGNSAFCSCFLVVWFLYLVVLGISGNCDFRVLAVLR